MPAKRKDLEIPPHLPGIPARPKGLKHATRNAWNSLVKELAGKLYQDDGDRLLELIQCRADAYRGTGERKEAGRKRAAELLAKFGARDAIASEPIPDAPENGKLPGADLDSFLAAIRQERASYPSRLT